MTVRLNTTQTETTGAEFAPGGEFNVQCDATDPKVIIDVYAKVDAAAALAIIDSFQPALKPIKRFVAFASVKFGCRGNKAGTTLNVWTA